jgi:hypothetical protein
MRPQRLLITLAVIAPAIAGLAACSSSNDSTSPKPQATPAVDTILADIDNLGVLEMDTVMSTDTTVWFGEYTYGTDQFVGYYYYSNGGQSTTQYYRPVITYNLPTLLGQGVVDSAKAYVYQCGIYGYTGSSNVDPYTLGKVIVDHVNIGRVVESSATTYMGDMLQANIATLSSDSSSGVRSMTVTTNVQADYAAKRPISQYRLEWQFTTPPSVTNSGGYYADLGSDCGGTGGPGPWLVVWSH